MSKITKIANHYGCIRTNRQTDTTYRKASLLKTYVKFKKLLICTCPYSYLSWGDITPAKLHNNDNRILFLYEHKGYSGIRQWKLNWNTFLDYYNKITPSVILAEKFVLCYFVSINQNLYLSYYRQLSVDIKMKNYEINTSFVLWFDFIFRRNYLW